MIQRFSSGLPFRSPEQSRRAKDGLPIRRSLLRLRAKEGQILVLALILLVVVMIISTSLFSRVIIFLQSGSRSIQWEQATVIADAGADYAVWQLNLNSSYAGNETKPLGTTGEFQIATITTVGYNKKITSTGCIPAPCLSAKVKRVVKVQARGANYGSDNDVYCLATDDCKISFYDAANAALRMSDCDDATCTTKILTTVDSKDNNNVGQYSSIYCSSSTDCKISYRDSTNGDLKFADCDDATCYTKTLTTVDSTGFDVGEFTSVYCLSSTDCKISYYDVEEGDLKYEDCDHATCTTKTLTKEDPTGGDG